MTSDTDQRPARGRPRDAERTAAILEATYRVLKSQGWEDLTVGDIAKTAGCGLATIYRRWETKEALVADAMRAQPVPSIEETGDPAVDLRTLLMTMVDGMLEMGDGLLGFMAAAKADPALGAALDEGIVSVARPRLASYLGAIVGDDSPHLDLLVDAVAGTLLFRVGLLGATLSAEDFADEVMALIDDLAPQPEQS